MAKTMLAQRAPQVDQRVGAAPPSPEAASPAQSWTSMLGNAFMAAVMPGVADGIPGCGTAGGGMSGIGANAIGATANTKSTDSPTTDPPPAGQAPIDIENINKRADEIYKASDGWGTNDDALLNAMRGLSPAEVAALKQIYKDHYSKDGYGGDLDKLIDGELSFGALDEAKTHLEGNKIEGAIETLENSVGLFGDDEEAIEATLRSLSQDEMAELQAMAANDPKLAARLADVRDNLGGEDGEVFDALMAGKVSTADAIRLDEAMGTTSLFGWGTDEEAVNRILEQSKDKDSLKLAFADRMNANGETGTTLDSALNDELSGTDNKLSNALLAEDPYMVSACKLQIASEGFGTDEKAIYDILAIEDVDVRNKLIATYEGEFGSLDKMLDSEMDGDDYTRAQQLQANGVLDATFALHYSMNGLGTDEDMLKSTLSGLSVDQLNVLKEDYFEAYGIDLSTQIEDELSGRDAFDVDLMFKYGEPETEEDKYKIAQEKYDFERGSGSNFISVAIMDFTEDLGFHTSSAVLEGQMDRLEQYFDEDGKLKSGVDPTEVNTVLGYQDTDITHYQETKDAVTDKLATGVGVVAGLVATVASGGTLGPVALALISGLSSTATKAIMQGSAYGDEALMGDLAMTFAQAATAGIANTKAVTGFAESLASGINNPYVQKFVIHGIKGATQDSLMGLYSALTDENALNAGAEAYLKGILGKTIQGGTSGFISGGTSEFVSSKFFTPGGGYLNYALRGGVSQGTGDAFGSLVNPNLLNGDIDALFENFASSFVSGFATGSAQGLAQRTVLPSQVQNKLANGEPVEQHEIDSLTAAEKKKIIENLIVKQLATGDMDLSLLSQNKPPEPIVQKQYEFDKATLDDPDTFSRLIEGDDPMALTEYLDTMVKSGSVDSVIALSYELQEHIDKLSPTQKQAIGEHFFNEGMNLDQMKQNGVDVSESYDKSHLLAGDWAEELALRDQDTFGNKIGDVLSVNSETYTKNKEPIDKYLNQNGIHTDQTLPSNLYTHEGNLLRYMNKIVHLYQDVDGVRLHQEEQVTGQPRKDSSGTIKGSTTADEIAVGKSLKLVGPDSSGLKIKPPAANDAPISVDGQQYNLDELFELLSEKMAL